MAYPCVSVIIPAYNAAKYIRECLDSVINQSYQSIGVIEIIVHDDGSTDETSVIMQEYRAKISISGNIRLIYDKDHSTDGCNENSDAKLTKVQATVET